MNRISKRLISKNNRFYKKAEEIKTIKWNDIPEDIQEKLINSIEEFLSDINSEVFQEDCDMILGEYFPNSNIKYTYSLSHSQGDGFGVYGGIDLEDALNLTNINLSDLEKDLCISLIDSGGSRRQYDDIIIYNDYYDPFFNEDMIDLSPAYDKDYINEMLEEYYTEEETKDFDIDDFCNKIKTLETKLQKFLSNLCSKLEDEGYAMIYPDEEDVIENIIENGDTVAIDGEEYQIV